MGLAEAMGDLQEVFTHNFIIGLLSQGRTPPVSPTPSRSLLERTRPRLLEERSRGGEDDPLLSPLVRATRWKVWSLRVWTERKRKHARELCSLIVYSTATVNHGGLSEIFTRSMNHLHD